MRFEIERGSIDSIHSSRAPLVFHFVVAVGVAAFATSPFGRSVLEVPPGFIWFGTALFIANNLEANLRSMPTGLMFTPTWWPRRALIWVINIWYCAMFAAPSSNPVTPTWAFVLMSTISPGSMSRRIGRDEVLVVVLSVLSTLVTAPDLSPLRVATAAYIAAASCVTAVMASRFTGLRLRIEARHARAKEGAEQARAESSRLAVAMSVHDGLSGAVFAARSRLETAGARAPELIASVVSRARVVLSSRPSSVSLEQSLRELPGVHDGLLAVSLSSGLTALALAERRDLEAITLELVGNALKHRAASRIEVTVTVGPTRAIEVVAHGSATHAGSGGRGGRNVQLRAEAWGGRAALEDGVERSVARAEWKAPSRVGAVWLALALPLATLAFTPLAALRPPETGLAVFTLVCIALATLGTGLGANTILRTDRDVRRIETERELALRAAEKELAALRASVDRLEATGDLHEFGACVTRTLHALENPA